MELPALAAVGDYENNAFPEWGVTFFRGDAFTADVLGAIQDTTEQKQVLYQQIASLDALLASLAAERDTLSEDSPRYIEILAEMSSIFTERSRLISQID